MSRPSRPLLSAAAALLLALAATGCASSGPAAPQAATGPAGTTATTAAAGTTPGTADDGAGPSAATRLICDDEAVEEISGALGIEPRQPLSPTWSGQVYSCSYDYPDGSSMLLSVRQLPDRAAAAAAFEQQRTATAGAKAVKGLGEAAFTRRDGSAYVLKDEMVLTVDVGKLPKTFGKPTRTRPNVGLTVATTVMICWKEQQH
ncbi:hypothetical protein ACIQGZ_07905 [Streptomyces sp. NPDC092296]|uniref:hypothetical protein n=1 Tax=Streptomyces sp. NPDC092296 TaxID=3366012 RepID=UPI00382C35A2